MKLKEEKSFSQLPGKIGPRTMETSRNKLFIQNTHTHTRTTIRWRSTKGAAFGALFLDSFFPPCATGFFFPLFALLYSRGALKAHMVEKSH